MKVNTIKELEAVINLCRKRGVLSIEIDGIKMQLSDVEPAKTKKVKSEPAINDKIDTPDALSPEQILFWSSQPQEEPEQLNG